MGIKSQFIVVSHIPCVLTDEFLKVEFPKLFTVLEVRETRRSLNMFDYMVFVAAVLEGGSYLLVSCIAFIL